jgi:hypothetical protein
MTMTRHKRRKGGKKEIRTTGRQRARHTLERNGTLTVHHPTSTMKDWLPRPSTSLLSSPTNDTRASWLRRKKVRIQDTPKYSSSSDEESSDDEIDYTNLFRGLDRSKVDKINE